MKYSITRDHRDFFRERKAIEFEGLVRLNQLDSLTKAIDAVLAKRLKIDEGKLASHSPEALFLAGRDLWRDDEVIKRTITSAALAEVAAELIQQRTLRLGCDQYFSCRKVITSTEIDSSLSILQREPSLEEISCIQGLLCGLMICLECAEHDEQETSKEDTIQIFSKVAGNAIFFNPSSPIDFSPLLNGLKKRYLLVTFAHPMSSYILNDKDLHQYALKHIGYIPGDRLNDKWNPIIYRG